MSQGVCARRVGPCVALLAVLVQGVATGAPIPLADFARESDMEAPALSPAGTRIVFMAPFEGKRYVAVYDLTSKRTTTVLPATIDGFTARWCGFKGENRVLCGYRGLTHDAGRPYYVSRLVAVNADGSKSKVLVQNGKTGAAQLQDQVMHWLPDDPKDVLMQVDDDGNVYPSVFRVDVYSGLMRRVVRERAPVLYWIADRDGVVRFGSGYSADKGVQIARDSEEDDWRVLSRYERFDAANARFVGFGITPNEMLVLQAHNGRDAIFEMDLGEQRDLQLLFSHPEVDVGDAIYSPADSRLLGFAYETDKYSKRLIDPQAAGVQRSVDGVFPDTINDVFDGSRDGKRLLIASYSDVKPTAYSLFDLNSGNLSVVSATNRALVDVKLAPMNSVQIRGPEGISMPGYLTLPLESSGKMLPTVVYPHGGPYARDSWGYDPVVQMLASRGYAVVQVNFRGSTGYGNEWLNAGFQGWGTVMHADITAAARWAVAEGIADPARMCIVGWSYGGYAALIGGEKEPDLYRCVVSIAGVSDLRELQNDRRLFHGGREGTRNATGTEDLELNSPIRLVDRMKVPVLLVHGTEDVQVHADHSRAMAKALKRAGKDHELVLIEEGDHSLDRADWRLRLYEELERFLGVHLAAATP